MSGVTGLILIAYAPHSWRCMRRAVKEILVNPQTASVVLDRDYGHNMEIWTSQGDQPLQDFAAVGQNAGVVSVAYAPDGETVLTGSADGTAILWDARSGVLLHTLQGH